MSILEELKEIKKLLHIIASNTEQNNVKKVKKEIIEDLRKEIDGTFQA